MDFFRFLGSKKFFKHLAGAVVIAVILIWGVMLLLRTYTKHGDYLIVPDFKGKAISQLLSNPAYPDFDLVVIDSVFDLNTPHGTVIHQDPYPESKVKAGRKIYLTIVSSIPEKVSMPDLKFLTLRQAGSVLESCGLKIGKLTYIQTFDEDAVQQQYYQGKVIEPGTKIEKGSVINLVVGMGSKGQEVSPGVKPDSVTGNSM
ncbi:MAG: PASTA domain-containing protein [Bacteroidetes bacterium]|nr:PASTA domain-containing protein [Bacteroidota bacterium]